MRTISGGWHAMLVLLCMALPAVAGAEIRVLALDPADGSTLQTGEALAQQELQRAPGSDGDGFWTALVMLAGWSVPGYFILQAILWRRWQGGWRRLALVPLWGAAPVTAYTLFALLQGSNLWPLVMLFTLPFGFLYLLALVVLRAVSRPRVR